MVCSNMSLPQVHKDSHTYQISIMHLKTHRGQGLKHDQHSAVTHLWKDNSLHSALKKIKLINYVLKWQMHHHCMVCRKDMYAGCHFYLQCRACTPLVVNFFCACLLILCTYAQQGYVFQSGFLRPASYTYKTIHAFPNTTLRPPALK